jgi:HPr kinase/phosphorylase
MIRLHASCVAINGRALLIRGASGSGKSALALELIALGAALVADDQVDLTAEDGRLIAAPPEALAGLIEARGLGLLRLPFSAVVPVGALLDLDTPPAPRLPRRETETLCGVTVERIARPFPLRPAAVFLLLRHGPRLDPDDGSSR